MAILNSNARGSPEGRDGRRHDMWVATGTERRVALFTWGKLYCPRGHRVPESAKVLEGCALRHCEKKTPIVAPRGEVDHEPPCDTWLFVVAGLRAFDGEDPSTIELVAEISATEARHIVAKRLGTIAAAEYLGLLAWTRR